MLGPSLVCEKKIEYPHPGTIVLGKYPPTCDVAV